MSVTTESITPGHAPAAVGVGAPAIQSPLSTSLPVTHHRAATVHGVELGSRSSSARTGHPPSSSGARTTPSSPQRARRAYLRDLPDAELHLLDTGHFALDDMADEMIPLIRDFLRRRFAATHLTSL